MRRFGKAALRTLAFIAGGTILMILIGRGYALTTATCTTICDPAVSGPLGAIAGLIVAVMMPSARWAPLD